METIGDRIAYYRTQRGLSRKETIDGICDESTLFRIEKGNSDPSIYIIQELCKKLNIPVSYIFEALNDDIKHEITFMKQRCRKHVYYEEYDRLSTELNKLHEHRKQKNIQHKSLDLFITWHQAILLRRKNNDPKSAHQLLENVISVQPVLEVEIGIMNTMGLICASLEEQESAFYYFQTCFLTLKTFPSLDDPTLFIRVGYNYASRLYFNRDYQKVMMIINELLDYLQIHQLKYMQGHIYHLLAITHGQEGDLNNTEKCMGVAITIFGNDNNVSHLEKSKKDLEMIRANNIQKKKGKML